MEIFNWVLTNKEWLFGGIGLAAVGLITKIIWHSFKKEEPKQVQKSGKDSINLQSAGDIKNININVKSKERK